MNNLITQFFSVDHDRLDFLYRQYQRFKLDNRNHAKAFFDKFRDGLKQHIEWEEQLLFPAFEGAAQMHMSGPTFVMRQEHGLIQKLLDHIHEDLCLERDPQALETELEQLLTEHNNKEEQILYVQCDRLIKQNNLADIFLHL
ncbi:hemerythrin domain-containing protein [Aestuariibacter halophilus]|uniref:Hemerythrin domain-containing protein n=1 Tax=Fluctibacter halophilus TaxID=226011 RepID=A0ABS8G3I2_9ALTE|nr:hemerythrin domain-containing protein [Aestuariibacter halophilus]MCC2615049.1 hemerythrin domain-containing protein [Aestuariibacter halophilus]